MRNRIVITALFHGLVFLSVPALAQRLDVDNATDSAKAYEKGMTAIKLMDGGQVAEAIVLLEAASKLDPKNIAYQYETGYAYFLYEDYKKALEVLVPLKDHPQVDGLTMAMIGNAYDMAEQPEKAIETYDEGIRRFPKTPSLYLERGTMEMKKQDYSRALFFYENGIKADPTFPSNYYRCAQIYAMSTDEVYAMMYGEIFLNLEPATKRSKEISKSLFDIYKREITFEGNTIKVSFCGSPIQMKPENFPPNKIRLPFCMVYEPTMSIAVAVEKSIDLQSLNRIRRRFVESYADQLKKDGEHNVLFDYQYALLQAGHLEAYNMWLLGAGDQEAYDTWMMTEKKKWDQFVEWMVANPIPISATTYFHRSDG